jgi:hypothetical protein
MCGPVCSSPAYPVPLAAGPVYTGGVVGGSVVSSVPMMSPAPVALGGGCATGDCGSYGALPQTTALPPGMTVPAAPPSGWYEGGAMVPQMLGAPAGVPVPQTLQVAPAPQLAPAPAEVPASPIAPMHGMLPLQGASYNAPVQQFMPVGMQSTGVPAVQAF